MKTNARGLMCAGPLLWCPLAACGGLPFESQATRPEVVDALDAQADAADADARDSGPDVFVADAAADVAIDAAPDGGARDVGVDAVADGATAPDAPYDAPVCLTDLSGVGAGDFRITFRLRTSATAAIALLNQRAACGNGMMWDVRMKPTGAIYVETDDGTTAGYVDLLSVATVNDGAAHDVAIERAAGLLSVAIDGTASGAIADGTALGILPALQTGADPCADTSPLSGSITSVCLTR